MDSMHASVIIPTHNRERILTHVLNYYTHQVPPDAHFELIVIDDGSDDGTQALFGPLRYTSIDRVNDVLRRHRERIMEVRKGWYNPTLLDKGSSNEGGVWVTYVKLVKSGRSIARNVGIACASYPLIIFADDDIFVEPEFIKKHIGAHRLDDECVIMGKVIHTTDLEDPLSARWKPKDINTAFLSTGNASVLKKYLVRAGLFDENYTVYGWEDFDLGVHLKEIGLQSVKRRIYGYHLATPPETYNPKQIYEKEKERGITAVYFYYSHPLPWVRRFTLVDNSMVRLLFNLLGRNNWFLSKGRCLFLRGLLTLIVRYKGYFDGVEEGKKHYGYEQ